MPSDFASSEEKIAGKNLVTLFTNHHTSRFRVTTCAGEKFKQCRKGQRGVQEPPYTRSRTPSPGFKNGSGGVGNFTFEVPDFKRAVSIFKREGLNSRRAVPNSNVEGIKIKRAFKNSTRAVKNSGVEDQNLSGEVQ